ncbi:LysE family translocator [Aquabacter spiritensis]|uniref:Threonine/homoserine/homoserine lactone efflux protein n=1 Tax=Aquabacter spiritensis TaxID=933073 RepID=A0A4R3LYB4_9HYPH|nr:LysE family translocator [Aquabacter spiritensis]TCT05642.1 threonine/homoserine/homoserine lactone efflux protein [Aquabacter spiritensis]
MFDPALFLAFLAAATLLTVTPGADTAMVLRTAACEGPRAARFAAGGILAGCLIWGAAVSLGLGALLQASEVAYAAVKWAGAGYLIWLGATLLAWPRRTLASDAPAARREGLAAWRRGFLTNMLNPKIGVFYVTFLPQFIPPGASVAAFSFFLAAVHVALTVLWFAVLIGAAVPLRRALSRPALVQALDRVTGGLFIAFGLKLAVSRA